jgi:hypothetical protein
MLIFVSMFLQDGEKFGSVYHEAHPSACPWESTGLTGMAQFAVTALLL